MKIVLTGDYPYGDNEIWGGVQSVLSNLKDGFKEERQEIKILSSTSKSTEKYEYKDDLIYVKIPRFKLGSAFLSSYPWRIKEILKRLDFDVLNCHSVGFAYYGLKYYDNLLFTLHGVTWEEEKYLPLREKIGWRFFYSNRLKKILKDLKYMISINPYVTDLVRDHTEAKIFEIPNPVPEEYFDLDDRSEDNRLFYIGVLSRRKNLMGLVEALKIVDDENKDFKLYVAGKIDDRDYIDQIKRYVSEHGLEDKIKFLGMISKEEKFEQLEKMSALILPSLQETAPMVISEAFAAGKPVIASDVGGNRYMIGEEERGLIIDLEDKKDIAEKIIRLLDDKKAAEKMGRNAKNYALKNHHIDEVKKRYLDAYEYVLED